MNLYKVNKGKYGVYYMCGITGLFYNNRGNALEIYESLLSIQHRGQDGAGICNIDDEEDKIIKGKGLICNLFNYDILQNMKGRMFIGHTRYKTNNVKDSFQPFILKNGKIQMSFCHNGNIINVDKLAKVLSNQYGVSNSVFVSDSYLLFQLIFYFLDKEVEGVVENKNIESVSNYLHECIEGSYSIILYIKDYGMVMLKDKYGIRPLVYGSNKNNDVLVSSESCSLNNVLNYDVIDEVNAGETVIVRNNMEIYKYQHKNIVLKPCLFEYIYFSRLDSCVNGISIYNCRYELGKLLGEKMMEEKENIDFIIPTPETSRIYAYGMSEIMNIPIQECIIKNRYINRTFIIENKDKIEENIKRKFSVIREIIKGKNVILLDDSIVRGNTSKNIIKLLKESGVNKVIFGSASPKIFNTNRFGIYIEKKEELITHNNKTNENIASSIGANKIYYNELEDVIGLVNKLNRRIGNMEVSMFKDD